MSGEGEVIDLELVPAAVVARVDSTLIDSLMRDAEVQAIERAPAEQPLMDTSVQVIGSPSWWGLGFAGGTGPADQVPADAAVEGEAPDPDHPAFAGVEVDISPEETPGDHGTHTAGVIASNDAVFRGVAYGLDRLIGANNEPYALGIPDGDGSPGAADAAEVINRSFGGTGDEDADLGTDVTTALFGVSRTEPAGNSNIDGSPTVENVGRNMLSVAAFNDLNTLSTTDDVVLGVSSRGPTPGGRKKPDLIAPGGAIEAPAFGGGFTAMSGTSLSAPHVAGAMTLLEGAGITDEKAQRAILINSARDWNGVGTELQGWASPQTGWRPEVGWGALDLTTALAQRGNYELGAVQEGEASFYSATMPVGGKATLAFQLRGIWPNFPQNGLPPLSYTQSDLNLRQYTQAGAEIPPPAEFDAPMAAVDAGPDAVDPNDTVEQVRAPTAQTITYKVESASEIDGASTEPFAVAAAADLDPLVAPLTSPSNSTASPSSPVACDQPVVISTELVNASPDLDSTSSAVSIELPSGLQLTSGAQTQSVSGGTLEASATSETKNWTIQATTNGSHVVTIAGVGQGLGTPFRRIETVQVHSDCEAPDTAIDSGPEGPTNDSTPAFNFSATGGATGFECSLDGAIFENCQSGTALGPLSEGQHTFAVRANDAVGNVDASPSSRTFTIDTTPPDTTIVTGPPLGPANSMPRFAFEASEGSASFSCAFDVQGFSPCTSPHSPASLNDGKHTFAVRATDAAGNSDLSPATRTFGIDSRVGGVDLGARAVQPLRRPLGIRLRLRASEPATVRLSGKLEGTDLGLTSKRVQIKGGKARRILVLAPPRTRRRASGELERGMPVWFSVRAKFEDGPGNIGVEDVRVRVR